VLTSESLDRLKTIREMSELVNTSRAACPAARQKSLGFLPELPEGRNLPSVPILLQKSLMI
jgi:hypothetical protein